MGLKALITEEQARLAWGSHLDQQNLELDESDIRHPLLTVYFPSNHKELALGYPKAAL